MRYCYQRRYNAVVNHEGKPFLIFLSKTDLVPEKVTLAWQSWIHATFPQAILVRATPPSISHSALHNEFRPSQRRRLLKRHAPKDAVADLQFSRSVIEQCAEVC